MPGSYIFCRDEVNFLSGRLASNVLYDVNGSVLIADWSANLPVNGSLLIYVCPGRLCPRTAPVARIARN